MTTQAEKLLPKIEKAGIKASLKAGHVVSQEELLAVKVQLMPTLLRWTLGGFSAAAAYGSYLQFVQGDRGAGVAFAALMVVLFFFAVVGIRKTLGKILDGMNAMDAAEVLRLTLQGIWEVAGGLADLG